MSEQVVDFSRPMPLFPLAGVVLMPHATVPLHIFERRYRDMTRDAIEDQRIIAMASFAGEQYKFDYTGNPPVRPIVCVGQIIRYDHLPDGRYNILLHGIGRARVSNEINAATRYRQAYLEPIPDESGMDIDLGDHRERLDQLLRDPLLGRLAALQPMQSALLADLPTAALVDLTTLCACDDQESRYRMLAEPDVARRARWLEGYLQGTRTTMQIAERFGPAVDENGVHLN